MQPHGRDRSAVGRPEKVFGRVLQEIRRQRGFSQEKLGFESGYHPTYISQLERGVKNPSLRTIMDLASTLGVAPSKVIARVEERLGRTGYRRPTGGIRK